MALFRYRRTLSFGFRFSTKWQSCIVKCYSVRRSPAVCADAEAAVRAVVNDQARPVGVITICMALQAVFQRGIHPAAAAVAKAALAVNSPELQLDGAADCPVHVSYCTHPTVQSELCNIELSGPSKIISPDLMKLLWTKLPRSSRHHNWRLLFSTEQHGDTAL